MRDFEKGDYAFALFMFVIVFCTMSMVLTLEVSQ